MIEQFTQLFKEQFQNLPTAIQPIASHGSQRRIFRLSDRQNSAIAVAGNDLKENRAFLYFTRHFLSYSLAVPAILAVSPDQGLYLLEDLGDLSLYQYLTTSRQGGEPFSPEVEALYSEAVKTLPFFQIKAGSTIDYSYCHNSQEYGRVDFLADLESFVKNFLVTLKISYQLAALQKEFEELAEFLSSAPRRYFLYRDFQARNIMVYNQLLYFLDYQSGRRGALQYDLVSLLFQSQAKIPTDARERLLAIYLAQVEQMAAITRPVFMQHYSAFILIRLLQVLATYGKLGLGQGKEYFLKGIPAAIENLRAALQSYGLPLKLPELERIIEGLNLRNYEICRQ